MSDQRAENAPSVDFSDQRLVGHVSTAVETTAVMIENGHEPLHTLVYLGADHEWIGTVLYAPHEGGRKQALFRALGQVAKACGARLCISVGDVHMGTIDPADLPLGAYSSPSEDPRSHEAIIANLLLPEGVFARMFVQRYSRNDDGTIRWHAPTFLPAGNYLDMSVDLFGSGWTKSDKTLTKALSEARKQAAAVAIAAADPKAWGLDV